MPHAHDFKFWKEKMGKNKQKWGWNNTPAEAAAVAKSSCGIHSEYENRVQNREMYRVGWGANRKQSAIAALVAVTAASAAVAVQSNTTKSNTHAHDPMGKRHMVQS